MKHFKLKGFKKFMYSYVSGGVSFALFNRQHNFPKTALFMIPGISISAFTQPSVLDKPGLFAVGTGLIVLGIISFLYPTFFPIGWDEMSDELKVQRVKKKGLDAFTAEQLDEYDKIISKK